MDLRIMDVEVVTSTANLLTVLVPADPVHLRLRLLRLVHPQAAILQGRHVMMELIAAVVHVTNTEEVRHVLRQ